MYYQVVAFDSENRIVRSIQNCHKNEMLSIFYDTPGFQKAFLENREFGIFHNGENKKINKVEWCKIE